MKSYKVNMDTHCILIFFVYTILFLWLSLMLGMSIVFLKDGMRMRTFLWANV